MRLKVIEVDGDDQSVIFDGVSTRDEQGGQETYGIDFGEGGIELDPSNTYAFVLEYQSLTKVDLRGMSLVDLDGEPLFALNEYPTGADDVPLMGGSSADASTYEGVIYVVEGNGSGFDVTDAIGYDIAPDGTLVLLDSTKGAPAFELDLSLLTADDPNLPGDQDLIDGTITRLDISGEHDEANVVTLSPTDVLDLADGGDVFTIVGDANDTVNLSSGEWAATTSTEAGFDAYSGTAEGSSVTLLVETEVQVNLLP